MSEGRREWLETYDEMLSKEITRLRADLLCLRTAAREVLDADQRKFVAMLDDSEEVYEVAHVAWNAAMDRLECCPVEMIRRFMDKAVTRGATRDTSYIGGCVRMWRKQQEGAA